MRIVIVLVVDEGPRHLWRLIPSLQEIFSHGRSTHTKPSFRVPNGIRGDLRHDTIITRHSLKNQFEDEDDYDLHATRSY